MSLTSYLAAPSRDFVTSPHTGDGSSLAQHFNIVKHKMKIMTLFFTRAAREALYASGGSGLSVFTGRVCKK